MEGQRIVHANPAARRAGLSPGMSVTGAKQLAPKLHLVPAEAPRHAYAWQELLEELYGFTPWLEPIRPGLAYLKIEASEADLLARAYHARVGLAASKQISLLAAASVRPGELRCVAPGREPAFLEALPMRFLKGVALPADAVTDLEWLGVDRAFKLARWHDDQIRRYLGSLAPPVLQLLRPPWDKRVARYLPAPQITARHDFDEPAREPCELEGALGILAARLERELAGRHACALKVTALVSGIAFPAVRLAKSPLADAAVIARHACLTLSDTQAVPLGIDALEVSVSGLKRHAEARSLFKDHNVQRATAAVNGRYPGALKRFELRNPYSNAPDERYGLVTIDTNSDHTGGERYADGNDATLARGDPAGRDARQALPAR